MHIFFSVGEPSGDEHAAHLITKLRQRHTGLRVSGFGGPKMEARGLESIYRLTDLAVMGIFQVIPLLGRFFLLMKRAERFFAEDPPDAVVLVDFPGFNWWIARKARAAGIPVFYYLPPQLWAWASWRVRRVRRFVDHVISSLPFERDWYEQHGVEVHYVGHPFFDEVHEHPLDARFVDRWSQHRPGKTIAVLPGSRSHEIHRNWPVMIEVMKRLHARHSDVTFLVACYREKYHRYCLEEMLQNAAELPVQFFVGKTSEIIEAADCALMVSGSVSLEMVARGTPAVVLYRTGWPTYCIGRMLVHCRFMSLANLIGRREIMPEFLSVGNPEPQIRSMTDILDHWLRVPEERHRVVEELQSTLGTFIETGATIRTAEFILDRLKGEHASGASGFSEERAQARVA